MNTTDLDVCSANMGGSLAEERTGKGPHTSLRLLLWGGIEPGVIPPMSAWCPREATKNTGLGCPAGVGEGASNSM